MIPLSILGRKIKAENLFMNYVQFRGSYLILAYPVSVPLFFYPVAIAELNLTAQCLRKLTANVLAIRNGINLKGPRTVKRMHIRRKARIISPFATQTTVKYPKIKSIRWCA